MSKILVTGANRGIGLEFCRQLHARGDDVIAVCRQASPELQKLGVRIMEGIDVSQVEDVARLSHQLRGAKLDVIINNAGILVRDSLDRMDFEGIARQFEINAMAPLRVSTALLGQLAEGAKIITITSSMGSIAENTSGAYYGYRMSKAAVNMAMKSLSEDLRDKGISVMVLHPGYVATDMTSHQGPVSPEDAVKGLLARIDDLDLSSSGSFRHAQGREIPW